jgi:ADP-heptose:LPS heptosyltransferase
LKFTLQQKQYIDTALGLPLLLFNKFFAVIFGFILKRNHSLEKPPQKIVVIKILGFGSVLLAADSLFSIKKKYPTASFNIICSRSISDGIHSLKLFDEIYILDDSNYFSIVKSTILILRKCWFKRCWIIDLEVYSKLSSLFSLWTLGINRFGFYFKKVGFRRNINTHNILFDETINVIENYQSMASTLGVTHFEEYKIEGFEQRDNTKPYQYIAINNTCSELAQERLLTEVQLSSICNWILKNTTYKIALLGTASDFDKMELFIKTHQFSNIENTCGKFKLNDYYTFLYHQCKLLITIDSAPLHIANKLSIPVLSIWGPSSPQSRVYKNNTDKFIYHQVPCSPCVHTEGELPCKGNNFCIKEIGEKEFIFNLEHML